MCVPCVRRIHRGDGRQTGPFSLVHTVGNCNLSSYILFFSLLKRCGNKQVGAENVNVIEKQKNVNKLQFEAHWLWSRPLFDYYIQDIEWLFIVFRLHGL